jgi:hypothetical protein
MGEMLKGAVAGLVGGSLGTAMMRQSIKLSGRLPEKVQPTGLTQDPGDFIARKAASVAKRDLPEASHRRFSAALHWMYGTFWPTALGLALRDRMFRRFGPTVATGAGLGAGVWAVGYLGWLPAAGLVREGQGRRVGRQAMSLLNHVFYGVLSVAPLHLMYRLFPRRRRGLLAALGR